MVLHALPFAVSLLIPPVFLAGLAAGGVWVALLPVLLFGPVALLDRLTALNKASLDPATPEGALVWHRALTWAWPALQLGTLWTALWLICRQGLAPGWQGWAAMAAAGMVSGAIGINFAHELIHRPRVWERRLGRLLLVSVLYGHFDTEHVRVHHRWVGTPRDPVTARYGEGFYHFLPRVLRGCLRQSWQVERARLARRGLPAWHRRNPFWQYGLGALAFLGLAWGIGGWRGAGLWLLQAAVAVWQLELVNYVEHYGLTRKHLGGGRYEPVAPRHSWNAAQRVTNWLLINLQRHSDHHVHPARSFPLLQHHYSDVVPQLPHGYPVMGAIALLPGVWRRRMNPRVDRWRARHYPEITDWGPYDRGETPLPPGPDLSGRGRAEHGPGRQNPDGPRARGGAGPPPARAAVP